MDRPLQNHLTTSPTSNRSSSASTNSLTLPSPSSSTPANGGNDGCSTPPTNEFYLRATTPQLISQGQYAVISPAGAIVFTAASPNDAAKFSLSTTNHLIHASKYAQIVPGTTSQVQFVSSACDLSKRSLLESRQAAPEPLTCIVTAADGTGAPSSNAARTPPCSNKPAEQASTSAPHQQNANPSSWPPSPRTHPPLPPTPPPAQTAPLPKSNPDFASQPDTVQFYGGYASLPNSGGLTGFAFSIFYHGAPLSLDADGHLVGVGPAPQGVAGNVAYAATFQIGSTFGPIAMMYGEIMAGYAPIVCRIPPGFDAGDGPVYSLQCTDGALGTLMTLQKCGSGNLFYLGDRVHTEDGCVAAFFRVYYTGN
ncbi:uncharacterized protein KY384_006304 [Bacidia gigantensis]|uniref:uncharacterized protein n=1 Tax=Bacidia gigantensis TaxID=2732470 RepID=UPI001D04BD8C|nr:uncharacterized protein KY384_006304 [Bacidia gigantensis]KAG8528617.1 hypothetical protein KY384_006304 [Bacidia gigantensis]